MPNAVLKNILATKPVGEEVFTAVNETHIGLLLIAKGTNKNKLKFQYAATLLNKSPNSFNFY